MEWFTDTLKAQVKSSDRREEYYKQQIPRNIHAQADYILKVQQGQHTCFAFLTRKTIAKHLCFPLGHREISSSLIGQPNLPHFKLYYEGSLPFQILKAFDLLKTERKGI